MSFLLFLTFIALEAFLERSFVLCLMCLIVLIVQLMLSLVRTEAQRTLFLLLGCFHLHEVFVGYLEPVLILVDLCHAIGADDRFRGRHSFE